MVTGESETVKVIEEGEGEQQQSPTCKYDLFRIHNVIQPILVHDIELSLSSCKIRERLGPDDLALDMLDMVDFVVIRQNHHRSYIAT
jgi:hypothetical protein